MRKRPELRRNLRVEVLQNSSRRGRDQARVGVTQHRQGDRRARPLEQIHIHGGTRRRIEPVIVNVAHDSNDSQQTNVAIHIPKLDGMADGVLIWPTVARQRFADDGNVRRVGAVALVEDSPANQRNSQRLEVSVRDDAEVRAAKALFLLEQAKTICGLGNLILRHEQKHSVWKAAIHWQAAGRANFAHAWDLFEPLNQICKENRLTCLCFRIFHPRKGDVHRNNFVYAEPGIHFQHFH